MDKFFLLFHSCLKLFHSFLISFALSLDLIKLQNVFFLILKLHQYRLELNDRNQIIFGETLTSDIEIALGFYEWELFWDTADLSDSLEISETDTDTLASVDSEAEGGTCSRVESVSLLQGSGDMAMMLAPILLLVGYAGWRRIK